MSLSRRDIDGSNLVRKQDECVSMFNYQRKEVRFNRSKLNIFSTSCPVSKEISHKFGSKSGCDASELYSFSRKRQSLS